MDCTWKSREKGEGSATVRNGAIAAPSGYCPKKGVM